MQAPPMLSASSARSKSLAPLPVSTAASTGEPLCANCNEKKGIGRLCSS